MGAQVRKCARVVTVRCVLQQQSVQKTLEVAPPWPHSHTGPSPVPPTSFPETPSREGKTKHTAREGVGVLHVCVATVCVATVCVCVSSSGLAVRSKNTGCCPPPHCKFTYGHPALYPQPVSRGPPPPFPSYPGKHPCRSVVGRGGECVVATVCGCYSVCVCVFKNT